MSRRLPIPALFRLRLVARRPRRALRLRLVARRPRRALLNAANIAVTIIGIVTVLAFHAFADDKLSNTSALTAGDCPIQWSTGTSRCSRSSR